MTVTKARITEPDYSGIVVPVEVGQDRAMITLGPTTDAPLPLSTRLDTRYGTRHRRVTVLRVVARMGAIGTG